MVKKAKKVAKKKVAKKRYTTSTTSVSKKVIAKPKAKKTKKKARKKTDGSCFVMVPFDEPFELYCSTIIEPAIKDAKLKPTRADDLFRPSPIVADIWDMIQKAKVLLAVLTTKNANVFYELGLAHAIGKPVVLVSETMNDVPFDLQQLRVLTYDKDDPEWGNKLKNSITNSLKETLDSPEDSVPGIFSKKVKSQAPIRNEVTVQIEDIEARLRSLEERNKSIGKRSDVAERYAERYLRNYYFRSKNRGIDKDFINSLVNRLRKEFGLPTGYAQRIVSRLLSTEPFEVSKDAQFSLFKY